MTNMNLKSHPAVLLGRWLRTARQAKGIVKRLFAGQIMLSPSEYTELEAGVIHWLQLPQQKSIVVVLDLAVAEVKKFNEMVEAAKAAISLSFRNLFSRDDLEPIRYRYNNKLKKPGDFEKETILNAVFSEIA